MKVKTSEIEGQALDYAVAVCEDVTVTILATKRIVFDTNIYPMVANQYSFIKNGLQEYKPSSNWSQAGPIIYREDIELSHNDSRGWRSQTWGPYAQAVGDTPLKAAMRCYVASKLGDEVEIPEELLK